MASDAILVCAVCAVVLLIFGLRRGPFAASTLAGVILIWGVPLRWLTLRGSAAPLAPMTSDQLVRASGALAAALVFALLGYRLLLSTTTGGVRIPRCFAAPARELQFEGSGRLWRNLWIPVLPVVALILAAGGTSAVGDTVDLLQSRVSTTLASRGYISIFLDVAVIMAWVRYLDYRSMSPERRTRSARAVMIVVIAPVLVGTAVFGSRAATAFFVVGLAVIAEASRTRRSGSARAVLGLAAVGVVIVLGGLALRTSAQSGASYRIALSSPGESPILSFSKSMPLVDSFSLAVMAEEDGVISAGSVVTRAASNPIPRALWPEKPDTVGLTIREHFLGDRLGGIPVTGFGEAYLFGRHTALILAGLFWGALIALMDRVYKRGRLSSEFAVAYAAALYSLVFGFMRTDTAVTLVRLLTFGLTLMLVSRSRRYVALTSPQGVLSV